MAMKRAALFLCLVGPTGGGKTTLRKLLQEEFGQSVRPSISATSRGLRPGEVDGVNYHYLTRENFEERIKRGDFFEWEEVHGNLYGTLRSNLEAAEKDGVDLLFDIDIRGALNFKQAYGRAVVIAFLIPPSFEVMRERLEKRGGETQAQLTVRYDTARAEYQQLMTDYRGQQLVDYFVVNDSLEYSRQNVSSILRAERSRLWRIASEEVEARCHLGGEKQP